MCRVGGRVVREKNKDMNIPEMKPVESSMIESVGYDDANKYLFVRFHNGVLWLYYDADPQTHENLMKANSIGKYFTMLIKRVYRGTVAHEREGGTFVIEK